MKMKGEKMKKIIIAAALSLLLLSSACSVMGGSCCKEKKVEKECCPKDEPCKKKDCKKKQSDCKNKDGDCKKKECDPSKRDSAEKAAPQMSEKEMMKAITEAATPGEEHARLDALVGEWTTTGKFWMGPGKEPEVSKGTGSSKWIMGKRFIKEDFTGKWMGQPFTGMGILGYDKVKKEYTSTWIDTMGTGVMSSSGHYDSGKNHLVMDTVFACPMSDGEKKGKAVTRIISKDEHVFEMYDIAPDGTELKMMEIVYKRKKK